MLLHVSYVYLWSKILRVNWQTLDIILKDLSEDREECLLKAANSGGVGLTGDPNRQAQGLK